MFLRTGKTLPERKLILIGEMGNPEEKRQGTSLRMDQYQILAGMIQQLSAQIIESNERLCDQIF